MAPRIFFVFLLFAGLGAAQSKPAIKKGPARPAVVQPPAKTAERPPAEATAATREFPIDSIQVEGTRILTPAGIIAASGLKLGQIGDTAVFDAARDRLLATGYFENLGYRFKPSEKGGYDLTFDAREM